MDTKDHSRFAELIAIMHRLRAPGGCPWDAEPDPPEPHALPH